MRVNNNTRLNNMRMDLCKKQTLCINRVSKTTPGGRRQSFSSVVAVSSGRHWLGVGVGKAKELIDSIKKAERNAEKAMFQIPCRKNTITHDVNMKFGATKIILKGVKNEGAGIMAGGTARTLLQLAEIDNVVCKIIGSTNVYTVSYALVGCLLYTSDAADD